MNGIKNSTDCVEDISGLLLYEPPRKSSLPIIAYSLLFQFDPCDCSQRFLYMKHVPNGPPVFTETHLH